MSIRYKLFLIIGLLFCAIFLGSFLVENRMASDGVKEVRKDLLTFYKDLEEEKRSYIDSILVAILSQRMGEVNTALEVVSKFSRIKEFFAPTHTNITRGTWKSAASLIQDRETIDFIQNTYEGKVSSLIVPQHGGMKDMFQVPLDEDLCWVYTSDPKTQQEPPYLGILLQILSTADTSAAQADSVPGIIPKVYVLYDQKTLENLPVEELEKGGSPHAEALALSVPFLQGYVLDIESYLQALAKAKAFLIKEKEDNLSFEEEENPLIGSASTEEEVCHNDLTCYFNRRVEYVNQLFMIWELCSLFEANLFGDSLSSSSVPKAISFFPDETGKGQGLYVKDILFATPKFDAKSYFASQPKDQNTKELSGGIALFSDAQKGTLFMGNTAELDALEGQEQKLGYLTLAFDLENVLQELSLNFKQTAWIVSGNRVISSLLPTGERYTPPQIQEDSLQKILEAPMGVFTWQGKAYYFVHLHPYSAIDLHFFLFNEAEVEFSLMKNLNKKIQKIIAQTNEDRRYVIVLGLVVLLLALLRLSKKITKPIIAMAEAANAIRKGTLYEVDLPKIKLGSQNEVQQLNESFRDMIEGLKEKEKVKGILDKVVSHDIAKEILKGEIHLGGEEREVTIFFADIRNFTSLTQKMTPSEVIALINTCMTRLSFIIEAHHGVIDKYIGDEVMVLFGAPLYKRESALDAVSCALEVMEELKRWNEERGKSGLDPVTMGIGIHTGKVCAGNMGAENRLNYTVIGSNVNLASRLCATAKPGEILISQDTLLAPLVSERIDGEDLGMIPLKGFDESKHVFRVKRKK